MGPMIKRCWYHFPDHDFLLEYHYKTYSSHMEGWTSDEWQPKMQLKKEHGCAIIECGWNVSS